MDKKVYFYLHGEKYIPGDMIILSNTLSKKYDGNMIARFDGCELCNYIFTLIAPNSMYNNEKIELVYNALKFHVLGKYDSKPFVPNNEFDDLKAPKYINGIVEAWAWYIFVVILALFFRTPWNIITWCIVSITFFTWRNNKMNWR